MIVPCPLRNSIVAIVDDIYFSAKQTLLVNECFRVWRIAVKTVTKMDFRLFHEALQISDLNVPTRQFVYYLEGIIATVVLKATGYSIITC